MYYHFHSHLAWPKQNKYILVDMQLKWQKKRQKFFDFSVKYTADTSIAAKVHEQNSR